MALVNILLLIVAVCVTGEEESNSGNDKHLEVYKSLFSLKRREQIETAERVWAVEDYSKQYKALTLVMETIFPLVNESLLTISEMKYVAGDPFPENQNDQEVLGRVYENVLFFGDFLLRMPDITKKIYKQHKKEWQPILKQAMTFCNQSRGLFSGPHATQLHLMAQEIGLIPEEPNYINPFRKEHQTKTPSRSSKQKMEKLKKKKRGPKLRGSRQPKTEL